jgi:hypothetical protein
MFTNEGKNMTKPEEGKMEEWQKQGFASEEAMHECWRQDHREQEMEQTRLMENPLPDRKYYLAELDNAKRDLQRVQKELEDVINAVENEDISYALERSEHLIDKAEQAADALRRVRREEKELEEEAAERREERREAEKNQLEGVAQ